MTTYERSDIHDRVVDITNLSTVEGSQGDGNIGYVLNIDGISYWYNGGWVRSDMTVFERNIISQMVPQLGTITNVLNTIDGSIVYLIAIIRYTATAGYVESMNIAVETIEHVEAMGVKVRIDLNNYGGYSIANKRISAQIVNIETGQPVRYVNQRIAIYPESVITDKYGKATLELISNDLLTPTGTAYDITIEDSGTETYEIPAGYEVELADLTPI